MSSREFAEKIRALGERCRPRDLYDVINLFWRRDLQAAPDLIRKTLVEKCDTKGVPLTTIDLIQNSPYRNQLDSEWKNMLDHQLPALPPINHYWTELSKVFDWLDGKLPLENLPSIAPEKEEAEWAPPPTIWAWGMGIPLETIRFAGANHLCIKLGYGGRSRIIAPYSLRRTRDGHLLLYAIRVESGEVRSYRVDRIQSVEVTTQPFQPDYRVEFAQSGPITAPPTRPRRSGRRR